MNTHVKDNLRYLKGTDGSIGLDNDLTITDTAENRQLTLVGAGAIKAYLTAHSANLGLWDVNRRPSDGVFDDTAKSHARIGLDGSGTSSFVHFNTAAAANTTATERMRITGDGRVGIGRTTPQGRLHGYDTISGFLHYEFDNVDGTARTVIPNAAGDVVAQLGGIYVTACNDGTTKTGALPSGSALTPGGAGFSIGENSGATQLCKLTVAADGSVTVQRTTGASATWDVALWLVWI